VNLLQRHFGNYSFTHICPIKPDRDEAGAVRTYTPQEQYPKRHLSRLHGDGEGPFCRFRIPTRLAVAGVYILTLADQPVYVGECAHLSKRYNAGYGNISPRNCYEGGRRTNCRLNNLIYQAATEGKRLDLWFLETDNRFAIETELIQSLNALRYWNRKR
jgi:hypothetical protein